MARFFTRTGGLTAIALLTSAMLAPMTAAPAQAAAARPCAMPASAPAVPAHAASASRTAAAEPVYFKMTTVGSGEPFIIELTDPALIEHARKILRGEETEKTHVMGRIIKRPAPYNPHYSFYLDPKTINFFQVAIEVCDATLSYTEDHLDEACGAFLPGCYFCPWTSKLVGEVSAP
ncbi:BP74-related protein [Streptosporangium sp. NBC_01756]|uniref:BP74-related protein n=1 Tax=Streptosporangium sp. NBC_01756 TaxID=2975950 RepID=UPI002DDBB136|nr:calmodulin-binding protein [Streptosporangium sp. NBC_01756]WSC88574.1 calmodulin-binding protein [Streptosporangium sp. NBC_01756]